MKLLRRKVLKTEVVFLWLHSNSDFRLEELKSLRIFEPTYPLSTREGYPDTIFLGLSHLSFDFRSPCRVFLV